MKFGVISRKIDILLITSYCIPMHLLVYHVYGTLEFHTFVMYLFVSLFLYLFLIKIDTFKSHMAYGKMHPVVTP